MKSRFFGREDARGLEIESEHMCDATQREDAGDSDPDDWLLSDESEVDPWADYTSTPGGFDVLNDGRTLSEDERSINPRLPNELDWTSKHARKGDDWYVKTDSKEHYHYMIP